MALASPRNLSLLPAKNHAGRLTIWRVFSTRLVVPGETTPHETSAKRSLFRSRSAATRFAAPFSDGYATAFPPRR